MQKLSAVDAVAPAWNHTHDFLNSLNWKLVLKLGLIAALSEMGGFSLNLGNPGKFGSGLPTPAIPFLAGLLLIVVFVSLSAGLLLFYLGSRLQFVFFEMVLRRDTTVAPMWSRYGPVTIRWMVLKLAYLLAALLCVLPFLVEPVKQMLRIASGEQGLTGMDLHHVLSSLLIFLVPLALAMLLLSAGYALLSSFGLPLIALEGLTVPKTIRKLWSLLSAEPGQFSLYAVMLVPLAIGVGTATVTAFLICCFCAYFPLGIVVYLLWSLLHGSGILGHMAMGLGFAVVGMVAVALIVALLLALNALTRTFFQAYALYFLGGRYPQLGDRLDGFNPPLERVTVSPLYPHPYPPPPQSYSI